MPVMAIDSAIPAIPLHDFAFWDVHDNSTVLFVRISASLGVSVTVGALHAVTVALEDEAGAVEPEHEIEKVVVWATGTDLDPDVATVPVQSELPEAVQAVALEEFHCRVTVPPERASAAEEDKDTVGGGGALDPPPPPQAVRKIPRNPRVKSPLIFDWYIPQPLPNQRVTALTT